MKRTEAEDVCVCVKSIITLIEFSTISDNYYMKVNIAH